MFESGQSQGRKIQLIVSLFLFAIVTCSSTHLEHTASYCRFLTGTYLSHIGNDIRTMSNPQHWYSTVSV